MRFCGEPEVGVQLRWRPAIVEQSDPVTGRRRCRAQQILDDPRLLRDTRPAMRAAADLALPQHVGEEWVWLIGCDHESVQWATGLLHGPMSERLAGMVRRCCAPLVKEVACGVLGWPRGAERLEHLAPDELLAVLAARARRPPWMGLTEMEAMHQVLTLPGAPFRDLRLFEQVIGGLEVWRDDHDGRVWVAPAA